MGTELVEFRHKVQYIMKQSCTRRRSRSARRQLRHNNRSHSPPSQSAVVGRLRDRVRSFGNDSDGSFDENYEFVGRNDAPETNNIETNNIETDIDVNLQDLDDLIAEWHTQTKRKLAIRVVFEWMEKSVRDDPTRLANLPDCVRANVSFLRVAVASNRRALRFVHPELLNNSFRMKKYVAELLVLDGSSEVLDDLFWFNRLHPLLYDPDVLMLAASLDNEAVHFLPEFMTFNKPIMWQIGMKNPSALIEADSPFLAEFFLNPLFLTHYIKYYGNSVDWRGHEGRCPPSVPEGENSPYYRNEEFTTAFALVPHQLRWQRRVAGLAVALNGFSIVFLPPHLAADAKIRYIAMEQNPHVEELLEDMDSQGVRDPSKECFTTRSL